MLLAKLEKDFGKGCVTTLSKSSDAAITHWSSTGSYEVDDAANWGIPGGRISEWFGAESSGKTTQLMAAMIENDFNGGENWLVDGESTFDQDRYVQMGGDPDKLNLLRPNTLEEFYDQVKSVIEYANSVPPSTIPSNATILLGVDTLTTIIPKDILEAEGDEQPVGAAARVNSRHLPTVDKRLPNHMSIVLLSQVRDKIGAAAWGSADANIDTPGGRVVKHHSSVRLFFNKMGQIDNGKSKEQRQIIGMKGQVRVVKCKIGPPLRKADTRIMFDHRGVDTLYGLLMTLVDAKLIQKGESGVYSCKSKNAKFKPDEFPQFVLKYPKWTAWAIEQAYELAHPKVNVGRYLRRKNEQPVRKATE